MGATNSLNALVVRDITDPFKKADDELLLPTWLVSSETG